MEMKRYFLSRKNRVFCVAILFFAGLLFMLDTQAQALTEVDPFETLQSQLTVRFTGGGTPFAESVQGGGDILGGWRWLTLTATAGNQDDTANVATDPVPPFSGQLNFNNGNSSAANLLVTWNGSNGSRNDNNFNAGAGFNFNAFGDRFTTFVRFCDLGVTMTLTVYTTNLLYSTATIVVPAGISSTTPYTTLFSAFVAGPTGGASFNTVRRMTLSIPGSDALDVRLEDIRIDCPIPGPTINSFTATPSTLTPPANTSIGWNISFGSNPISGRITSPCATPASLAVAAASGSDSFNVTSTPCVFTLKAIGTCDNATTTVTVTTVPPPGKVPSLNEWGFIILSLILAASAVWLYRKKKTNS